MTSLRYRAVVALTAIFSFTSCYTLDAYTGDRKVSSTTKGTAIGAAVGAAAGLLTGDDSRSRRKRALIAAGVGALAGGAIGRYMDAQEADLRRRLAETGVGVQRSGDQIELVMPGDITFATDQASLRPEFFPILDSVSTVLQEYDRTVVDVIGHTDSTGSDAHNQTLSERRAATVAQYLASRGIDPTRLASAGAGEQAPVAPNTTAEGRQRNRRVEIALVPLTS